MSTSETSGGRLRAYLQFVAAVLYFFLARSLAHRGAQGLAGEQWSPLAEQAMLVLLLLAGYALFGFWLDRQNHPVSEQGWPRREGWPGEAGLGLAAGWSLAVVCVLPLTLVGGIAIVLSTAALQALAVPMHMWDSIVLYGFKAKILFLKQTFKTDAFMDPTVLHHNADYPLLLPYLEAGFTAGSVIPMTA